jgi:hypothetical protein
MSCIANGPPARVINEKAEPRQLEQAKYILVLYARGLLLVCVCVYQYQ